MSKHRSLNLFVTFLTLGFVGVFAYASFSTALKIPKKAALGVTAQPILQLQDYNACVESCNTRLEGNQSAYTACMDECNSRRHSCLFCVYQDYQECASASNATDCAAVLRPSGYLTGECAWDTTQKSCLSRFRVRCGEILRNSNAADTWMGADITQIAPERLRACSPLNYAVSAHGPSDCSDFIDPVIQLCIQSEADVVIAQHIGCSTFSNIQQVEERLAEIRTSLPPNQMLVLTGNLADPVLSSNLSCQPSISYTIVNRHISGDSRYGPCMADLPWPDNACYRENLRIPCVAPDGTVRNQTCCPGIAPLLPDYLQWLNTDVCPGQTVTSLSPARTSSSGFVPPPPAR